MTIFHFALLAGTAFFAAGLLGLIPALLFPPPADAPPTTLTVLYGYLIGLFPVNVLHTAVHIVVGVWGLVAYAGLTSTILFARSLAVLYAVLAIAGLIPGLNTVFGFIPIHGHDVWLHGLTALAAGYFGFVVPSRAARNPMG